MSAPGAAAEAARRRLGELRAAADDAQRAGDTARAAALEQESAPLLAAVGDLGAARQAVERAVRLHADAGRELEAARARFALGVLEDRPGRPASAARTHFRAALEAFTAAGDASMTARAHARLGGIALRERDPAAAVPDLAAAAGAYGRAGDLDGLLGALRLLTVSLQLDRRPEEAYRWLLRAVEIAQAAGHSAAAALALDLRNLAGPDGTPPPLAGLVEGAAADPSPSVRAYALLTRSREETEAGRLDAARDAAAAAKQLALDTSDPVLYLTASLAIAGLEDQAGDRAGALGTLFTCQASLGDLLGPDARAPVLLVVDALRETWGEDAYQAALAEHRARVAS